jgi:hypothetical protein
MLRLTALIGAVAGAAVVFLSTAGAASPHTNPAWLNAAEKLTLHRVFDDATPTRVYRISYPSKIAVVFVFDHVVICGLCGGPSADAVPRGRVIRLSFDRTTHRLGGATNGFAMRFCEVRDGTPPLSTCRYH